MMSNAHKNLLKKNWPQQDVSEHKNYWKKLHKRKKSRDKIMTALKVIRVEGKMTLILILHGKIRECFPLIKSIPFLFFIFGKKDNKKNLVNGISKRGKL